MALGRYCIFGLGKTRHAFFANLARAPSLEQCDASMNLEGLRDI